MGNVVIDPSDDLDVAVAAGACFAEGSYILTTVFRVSGDTETAQCFRREEPESFVKGNTRMQVSDEERGRAGFTGLWPVRA